MSMSIWCSKCPASVQDVSVAEGIEWNRTHDLVCPGRSTPPGPREWNPEDEVRMLS